MSVFLIPLCLCEELERMMNSFWWGKNGRVHDGIKWKSWDKLCHHKVTGGLGFRRLHEFNLAMLGKLGCRLLQEPHSLVAKVFKARYYPSSSFLEAKLGSNPSYVWRSVLASQELLKKGVRWRIGTGRDVNVQAEPWLPDQSNPFVESQMEIGLQYVTVDSLIKEDGTSWDADILDEFFNERDKHLIYKIPLPRVLKPDQLQWIWDKKGCIR